MHEYDQQTGNNSNHTSRTLTYRPIYNHSYRTRIHLSSTGAHSGVRNRGTVPNFFMETTHPPLRKKVAVSFICLLTGTRSLSIIACNLILPYFLQLRKSQIYHNIQCIITISSHFCSYNISKAKGKTCKNSGKIFPYILHWVPGAPPQFLQDCTPGQRPSTCYVFKYIPASNCTETTDITSV